MIFTLKICRSEGETMTETEKMLRREIVRLETENNSLKERLKIADELNRKIYAENKFLNKYVESMEALRLT